MNIFLSIILITFVICKNLRIIRIDCLFLLLIQIDLDSSQAGELKVHNQPDYLSIATNNKNNDQTEQYSVGDLVDNLHTLFGLSADQVNNIE